MEQADHRDAANSLHAAIPPTALTIVGDPVAQSLSPVFQQAALDALGIPVRYHRTQVLAADVPVVLDQLRRARMGANVTMPHKALVASRMDVLTARAKRAGAVNTLWVDDGRLVGHNTDVDGIMATIGHLRPTGVQGAVWVIGAGGSAAAVLLALDAMGVSDVLVVARRMTQAQALIGRVGVVAKSAELPVDDDGWRQMRDAQVVSPALLINASPMGMSDDGIPVPMSIVAETQAACFDLVYRRDETAWVRAARSAGVPAEDGLRMLIEQGAAAFTCWFNRPAPVEVMWRAIGRKPSG